MSGLVKVMRAKKGLALFILNAAIIISALSVTSCLPVAPSVYESPLKDKTSVILPKGKEYLVYFEISSRGIGGSSSSSSADRYPTLGNVVTIYDELGNMIPNTITSGKIEAYWSTTSAGITVARFKLQGEGTRSIELQVDMNAYKQFASLYNERGTGPSGSISPRAPREPSKLVIRNASTVKVLDIAFYVIFIIVAAGFVINAIIKHRKDQKISSTPN